MDTQVSDLRFPSAFQFLFSPKRYKVSWGGRAGAKSWAYARALLILGMKSPLRVLCARELQNSIGESVHKLLSDQIRAMGFEYGTNNLTGYKIEQTKITNSIGTDFFFEGIRHNVDKIKSYEGIDICWVEEAQKVTKNSWDILIPTIRKPGSEIWVSFNPILETDATYERFVKHPPPDEQAIVRKVTYRDNPWLSDELLAEIALSKATSMDDYLHIWEGNCQMVLDGAVYSDEIRQLVLDRRICSVPYDTTCGVDTFWDLGYADKTAIWFGQAIGFEYHIIDYYENSQKKLDHYLEVLQWKKYIYNTHWLPHDAKAKEKSTGRSIEELMRTKVSATVRIVPSLSISDGINAARTLFSNCWFDEQKTEVGITALRHYCWDVNEGQLRGRVPLHNWASHGADAFRYLAIALKEPRKKGNPRLTVKIPKIFKEPMFGQSWMR